MPNERGKKISLWHGTVWERDMRSKDNDQTSQQNLTRCKLLDKPAMNKAKILQSALHLLNLEHVSCLFAAIV